MFPWSLAPPAIHWSNKQFRPQTHTIGWTNAAVVGQIEGLKQTEECFHSASEPQYLHFSRETTQMVYLKLFWDKSKHLYIKKISPLRVYDNKYK